jgi:hypothetical protein
MRYATLLAAALIATAACGANAQTATPLSSYADAKGRIDVQKLTCGQLAGTYQEDADMLMTWYSGWYNGLAKKHMINVTRGKDGKISLPDAALSDNVKSASDIRPCDFIEGFVGQRFKQADQDAPVFGCYPGAQTGVHVLGRELVANISKAPLAHMIQFALPLFRRGIATTGDLPR